MSAWGVNTVFVYHRRGKNVIFPGGGIWLPDQYICTVDICPTYAVSRHFFPLVINFSHRWYFPWWQRNFLPWPLL
jgi:hypothetical protein